MRPLAIPLLANPVSRYLGDISYSLYLWHFPVAILLLAFLEDGTKKYFAAVLGVTAVLSLLTHHFVENPVRRSTWLTGDPEDDRAHPRRWRLMVGSMVNGLVVLVAGVLVVGSAAVAATGAHQVDASEVTAPVIDPSASATIDPLAACLGAPAMDPASGCSSVDLGTALHPTIDAAAQDRWRPDDKDPCWVRDFTHAQPLRARFECSRRLHVALVGDSHLQDLLSPLQRIALQENWTIDGYVGEGCELSSPDPEGSCDPLIARFLDAVTSGSVPLLIRHRALVQTRRGQRLVLCGGAPTACGGGCAGPRHRGQSIRRRLDDRMPPASRLQSGEGHVCRQS